MKTKDKSLAEEHPQLFHYTSAAGLDGIIRSQTLRATHYAHLNDSEEIRHFLTSLMPKIFERILLDQSGEKEEARRLGKKVAKALQKVLLDGAGLEAPMAEPYITSFCTPSETDGRVEKHGLLSQWRGYGKDGGYALVFDTEELSQLLIEFGKRHENFGDLFAGDVVYSSDSNQILLKEFAKDLTTVEKFLSNQLSGNTDHKTLERIYIAIMRCACRYKHWGFKEENEVRLIFIPHGAEAREYAKTEGIGTNYISRKNYVRAGTNIPFVELLEGITSSTKPLPIRRVIVGPCAEHEKARRVRAVDILLKQYGIKNAEVTPSDIPYVG